MLRGTANLLSFKLADWDAMSKGSGFHKKIYTPHLQIKQEIPPLE